MKLLFLNIMFAVLCSSFLGCGGKAGIKWVRIPGGTFMMGADDSERYRPRHLVDVKTLYLAKTEVTNGQYRACVKAGVCTPPSTYLGGDDYPVIGVDWNKAKTFSEWVGGRLPSEAEWEYAAKSVGKDRKYPWGNEEPTCERVVMTPKDERTSCGGHTTWPVCSKPAGNTDQGLCDMAGNVWEWTQDIFHWGYSGAPTDGSAWENHPNSGSDRVMRGGSWDFSCRYGCFPFSTTGRESGFQNQNWAGLGFRPAR